MAATTTRRAEPAHEAPHPPYNVEAEEHVLGALMLAPTATDNVRGILQPRDFYRESHTRIYRVCLDLHDVGGAVDPITVADELAKRGELEPIGGKDRIREIATLAPTATNAGHYATIVAELARLRDIITFGETVQRFAWDRENSDTALAKARELLAALDERRAGHDLTVETWHQFESKAHDDIPTLVDELWPEAAFGFIAAPPKKGKTWVALALAVAVATGRPLFGHYTVPRPRPVLYVALEGHRAALRARVGAIARGMGINPDSGELDQLHFVYKPPGINLAEPTWAQRLRRAAAHIDAALAIVDVLRAGARIKENDQGEFTNLRHNLQPINDDGRSLALLHHFVKLSEISKERDPGERMSGSGAMFGALDAAIYITGSQNHARELRLSFDLRDVATPDDISIALEGEGTGTGGGYGYRDTATWTITEDETAEDDYRKAPPSQIRDYVLEHGGDVGSIEVRAHFAITAATLTSRLGRLAELGVHYEGGRGRGEARLVARDPEEPVLNQSSIDPSHQLTTDALLTTKTEETSQISHQYAPVDNSPTDDSESGDLQEEPSVDSRHFPTGSARARAREAPPERLTAQAAWIEAGGWMADDLDQAILEQFPMTPTGDLPALHALAAECEARELGGTP